MGKYAYLLLILITFISSCNTQQPYQDDLLIFNSVIVDIQNDTLLADKLVAISGEKITAIDESANRNKYQASSVFDAEGQYLIPGLWDMHVHFTGGDSMLAENKNLLPLFLAFGVTTVRDAGGDITSALFNWRQKISASELTGPSIYTSGPKLDNFSASGFIQVENQDEIRPALDSLESIGVDYVKLYNFHLSKEAYYGIIKEAEQRGLKTTGHVPRSAKTNPLKATEYGLDGVEHLHHLMKPSSAIADSQIKYRLGLDYFFQFIGNYDPDLARKSYRKLASHNLYVTPTIHRLKTLIQLEKQEIDHSSDSLISYLSPELQKIYQRSTELKDKRDKKYIRNLSQMSTRLDSMLVQIQEAGINLLAGTDAGPFSEYVFPGQSLHEELKTYVEAGLTPVEALRSSIVNGPKFFDQLDSYGSIEKGKTADLLLLRKNPLQNIEHTKSIKSVIARGQLYSQDELNMLLNSLKN